MFGNNKIELITNSMTNIKYTVRILVGIVF